jgi:TPR repeat protein
MRIALLVLLAATTSARAEPACQPSDGPDICTKRCDAGSQDSCAVLGVMHLRGELGGKSDRAKAEALLDRACKAKVALGCGGLGSLYGTRKDWKRARSLFESACTMGDALSCESLGGLAVGADGTPVADYKAASQKASVYYRRACDLGSGPGCAFVAVFIVDKIIAGTAKDALELYMKACGRGVEVACRQGADFLTHPMFTSSPFAKTVEVDRLSADLLARGCKLGDAKSCERTKKP